MISINVYNVIHVQLLSLPHMPCADYRAVGYICCFLTGCCKMQLDQAINCRKDSSLIMC